MSDLTGPLDPHALQQGRVLFATLPTLAANESIRRLYDHWSVEGYCACDGAYNIVIALKGDAWVAEIATSPRLNAIQVGEDHPYAAHTYHRNSHAVGIAVNGMANATTSDFGGEPVQLHEIEVLCAANGAVAKRYGIDLTGIVDGEPTLMTHAEAAIADGYAWQRWDLARLRSSSAPLTIAEAHSTAQLIRARSHAYKLAI